MGPQFVKLAIKNYIEKMTRKDSHMDTINIHIKKFGFHLCFASGGATPRCVHSVGLLENFGFELVFPGGIFFLKDQVQFLFKKVIEYLKMNNGEPPFNFFNKSLGEFTFKKAHDSWTTYLLKSAVTYHKRSDFTVLQIVPGEEHFTKDTPDLSLPFNTTREPICKCLKDEWSYYFPKNSNYIPKIGGLTQKIHSADI